MVGSAASVRTRASEAATAPVTVRPRPRGPRQGPLTRMGPWAPVAGGLVNRFERGRISWSAATGAHATRGAIATRYAQLGGEGGPLGFPVAEERAVDITPGPWRRPGAVALRRSDFQRGSLVLDPRTGRVTQQARG